MQITISAREVSAAVAASTCLAKALLESKVAEQSVTDDLEEGRLDKGVAEARLGKIEMAKALIENPTAVEAILRLKLQGLTKGPYRVSVSEDGGIVVTVDEMVVLTFCRMYAIWFDIFNKPAIRLMQAVYSLTRCLRVFKEKNPMTDAWREATDTMNKELVDKYRLK